MAPRGLFFVAVSILCCRAAYEQSVDSRAMIAEVVRAGSVIVRGIEFDAHADTLSPRSQAALEQVRQMLLEHTEWTFEVQVHSTEIGDTDRDRTLAAARAKVVVAWLTRNGISGARLVPKGYGSSKAPPASTAQDRVELRKLNEE